MQTMRILIVEDSAVLRDSLAQGLREAGYAVDAVADGKRGLIHAQTTDYDVIVLDWMLPEMDGLTVLSKMRAKKVDAAVLMLTARDGLDDMVLGLTTGADDYLVKPFAFKELLARLDQRWRRRAFGGQRWVLELSGQRRRTSWSSCSSRENERVVVGMVWAAFL